MTEDELNDLGQMIQRFVPKGAAWIVVIIPAHEEDNHPPGACPVQTSSNIGSTGIMESVLEGAVGMFRYGTHKPMFARPVEKGQ
jgi:hypothetical protein